MSVVVFLALLVIAMLMLSGLRLELQYRRGLKVGAVAVAAPGRLSAGGRAAAPRPSLLKVPDPYSD